MINGVIEAFAEFLNSVEGGIDLATLDKTDLTEVQTGLLGQFFLGQSLLQTGFADIAAEYF